MKPQFYSFYTLSSLKEDDVKTLQELGIFSIKDLLRYEPINKAQQLMAIANNEIQLSLDNLLDNAYVDNTPKYEISNLEIIKISGIGNPTAEKFKNKFGILTVSQLANFKFFLEAEKYLLEQEEWIFKEKPSAPEELRPKIKGTISSSFAFTSFVKEEQVRLENHILKLDNERPIYLDNGLVALFTSFGLNSKNPMKYDPEFYLGYIGKSSQEWINMGTGLGEPKEIIPLAPGQPINIAIVDWKRKQASTSDEESTGNEFLMNNLEHSRVIDEVVSSVAKEHQWGHTDTMSLTAGTGASATAGIGRNAGSSTSASGDLSSLGIPLSIGSTISDAVAGAAGFGGVFSAAGQVGTIKTDSRGRREVSAETNQNIMDRTEQTASNVRSLHQSIISTDKQEEGSKVQTTTIVNYNHSHSLNIVFYELIQQYRCQIRLVQATPIFYLPFRPLNFDLKLISNYWSIFKNYIGNKEKVKNYESLIFENKVTNGTKISKIKITLLTPIRQKNNTLFGGSSFSQELLNFRIIFNNGRNRIDEKFETIDSKVFIFDRQFGEDRLPDISNIKELWISPSNSSSLYETSAKLKIEITSLENIEFSQILDLTRDTGRFIFSITDLEQSETYYENLESLFAYFNSKRYFFTKKLLMNLEREQLIDVIESLVFSGSYQMYWNNFLISERPSINGAFQNLGIGNNIVNIINNHINRVIIRDTPFDTDRLDRSIDEIGTIISEISPETPYNEINTSIVNLRRIVLAGMNNLIKMDSVFKNVELHLSEIIHPEPIGFTDNCVMFNIKRKIKESTLKNRIYKNIAEKLKPVNNAPIDENDRKLYNYQGVGKLDGFEYYLEEINDLPKMKGTTFVKDIAITTRGLFAEAILGVSNASEYLNIRRRTEWHESPIPHQAPLINPVTAQSYYQAPLDTKTNLQEGQLTPMEPTPLPSPTGLASVLNAVQNGNMFRDNSGANQLTSSMADLSKLANSLAQQASTLAGDAREQALSAASNLAQTLAQTSSQLAQSGATRPLTMTEKGAALNELSSQNDSVTPNNSNISLPSSNQGAVGQSNQEQTYRNPNQLSIPTQESNDTRSILGIPSQNLNSENSNQIQNAKYISSLGETVLPNNINDWGDLITYNASLNQNLSLILEPRDFKVQNFEYASNDLEIFSSPMNIDYYKVVVTDKPKKQDGSVFTADEFLVEIRKQMGVLFDLANLDLNFFNPNYEPNIVINAILTTSFDGNSPADKNTFESLNPFGSIMQFDSRFENMGVVVSQNTSLSWTFSTVKDSRLLDGDVGTHPVSGNRKFGIIENQNGSWTIYTKGADRSTGIIETGPLELVFKGGHLLWLSWQAGLAEYVRTLGGKPFLSQPYSKRFNYDTISKHFYGTNI